MNPGETAKVLYIGLDACDPETLLRMAADGSAPNVAALLAESAVADVGSRGMLIGAVWMTFATGRRVGTHRYWNWVVMDPDKYEFRLTTPEEARGRPFWEVLSDAGRRVAVLDVPHSKRPDTIDGVVLTEWGCHDRHYGTASHPSTLLAELDEHLGRHPIGCIDPPNGQDAFAPCDYFARRGPRRTLDEERRLLDAALRGVAAERAANLHVLRQGPWDLFATVMGEGHCTGHQLWHVHQPKHAWHDRARRHLLGDPVDTVYRELDTAVGELIAQAGRDTTVYLHVSHGMTTRKDSAHLLDEVLLRIEQSLGDGFDPGRWSARAAAGLRHTPRWLQPVANWVLAPAARVKARIKPTGVSPSVVPPDASRRISQMYGNTSLAAIRFNVIGRQSQGLVEPGAEFEALRDEVARQLLELVDIDSGRKVVQAVIRSEEMLERSEGDTFPDLFVEWAGPNVAERVWSPTVGLVHVPFDHWRSGDHRFRGLLVARGPGIGRGKRDVVVSTEDIAPTIARALGVELPDIDGSPLADFLPTRATTVVRTPNSPPEQPVQASSSGGHRSLRRRHRVDRTALDFIGETAVRVDVNAERVDRVTDLVDGLARRVEALDGRDGLRQQVQALERQLLVWTTMDWLAREPTVAAPLISVVTPTYNRPERLAEAISSVIAERHEAWEMVVVDDGTHTARAVAERIGDNRVCVIDAEHGGVSRARNIALAHARGDVITYLDDDNEFHPGWLHAVAWAFRNFPEKDVLYGARIIDDARRLVGAGSGGWPWCHFEPFAREHLQHSNMTDMGAIAHRAGLPGAAFDEGLVECADWDLMLALTVDGTPLELPAIALYYRTDGTDRLSGQRPSDVDVVREKWRESG